MTFLDVARSLERSPFSVALRDNMWSYAALITAHVIALGIFLGTVMLVDLRLIGRGIAKAPLTDLIDRLLPWTRGAFAVLTVSGLLLFCTEAAKCYQSTAFRIKVAAIAAAGINVWIFHSKTYPPLLSHLSDAASSNSSRITRSRLAGIVSLLLWIAALTAGRAVGYNY